MDIHDTYMYRERKRSGLLYAWSILVGLSHAYYEWRVQRVQGLPYTGSSKFNKLPAAPSALEHSY